MKRESWSGFYEYVKLLRWALVACALCACGPLCPTSTNSNTPPAVPAPNSPVGAQLAWFLSAVNAGTVTSQAVTAHFSAAFVAHSNADALALGFNTMHAQFAPIKLVGFGGTPTPDLAAAVLVDKTGTYLKLTLHVDASEAHLIDSMEFAPAPEFDPNRPKTFEQLDSAVQKAAPNSAFLVAEVTPTGCKEVHGFHADSEVALGSAFKLWVLSTLAEQIHDGEHTWDEPLAISDAHKSIPSGDMRNDPAGTLHPLLVYAQRMISVSDNTAADHLLFLAGRESVEERLARAGHAHPELDIPFLGTREISTMKTLVSSSDIERYLASDVPAKRAFLDSLASYDLDEVLSRSADWITPRYIDTLEWFGSPRDICNVFASLKSQGDRDSTVYSILALNPACNSTSSSGRMPHSRAGRSLACSPCIGS